VFLQVPLFRVANYRWVSIMGCRRKKRAADLGVSSIREDSVSVNKTINQILGAPKVHKPKRAVKSLVSRNFYIDGNLFIERFDQVRYTDSMNNRNFRAKTIVDLAMSIECSLKSLIISLSKDNESPAKAYKKARKLSHNLKKLHKELKLRSKNRFKIPSKDDRVFDDLEKLGVGSRYSYEIWLLRFQSSTGSFFLGDDLISQTVDNSDWEVMVRNEAVMLNNLASKCHSKYLSKHSILSGKKFAAYDRALKRFLSDA